VRGGIDYAIAKSLAVAPYADILWMETKTADLHDAKKFADAIHAKLSGQDARLQPVSVVQLGHDRHERRPDARVPGELGKLGFVFNFITYGGHQVDGVAARSSPRRSCRTACSRSRGSSGRSGSSSRLTARRRRSSAARASTRGSCPSPVARRRRRRWARARRSSSTLIQTEVPPKVLEGWLDLWRKQHDIDTKLKVQLRPHTAGSELLELSILMLRRREGRQRDLRVIQDRRGRTILSVRDQNTFDPASG
jgi:isocitrate lyase